MSGRRWANADELLGAAKRLETQFREEIVEQPAVFLHGDFHGGVNRNVLADGSDITAVIDREAAACGDPRLDISVTEFVLRRRFNEDGRSFLAGYAEASGTAPGPLEPWEDLCGVRSRIVGVAQGPGRPGAPAADGSSGGMVCIGTPGRGRAQPQRKNLAATGRGKATRGGLPPARFHAQ